MTLSHGPKHRLLGASMQHKPKIQCHLHDSTHLFDAYTSSQKKVIVYITFFSSLHVLSQGSTENNHMHKQKEKASTLKSIFLALSYIGGQQIAKYRQFKKTIKLC